MSDLPLFSEAILARDLPAHGLRAGDVGTVVERHERPDGKVGYSVEFSDMTGATLAVAVVDAEMVRAPSAADVPSTRQRVA